MFARIVECEVRPDRKDEFNNKVRSELVPLLQKQAGFVDVIGLASENDPERLLSLSFWKTKEDAERFHQENYDRISSILRPLMKRDPTFDHFNVNTSTAHRIAAGKAA